MTDENDLTKRYYNNRKLAAQVYIEAAEKIDKNIPEHIRRIAVDHVPSKSTGLTGSQARVLADQYAVINENIRNLNVQMTNDLRRQVKSNMARGIPVSDEALRLTKTTRHDLEMEIKLDKIREDPEKYYQEARKKARKDIAREDREEMFRPFRKLLDWILRRG